MLKYQTVEELAAAYKSGDLDADQSPLIVDNDSTYVYDDTGKVFDGGDPAELLVHTLDLLGIPHDGA